jgi:hypothetical protein
MRNLGDISGNGKLKM